MVNKPTNQIAALDSAHYLHPFTDHQALAQQGARVIERASGIYVYDSHGTELLDAMSGLWCVNIGYDRAELAEVASRQIRQLSYYNSFFQTTNRPATELAARLVELAGKSFSHVFFTSSGSEANDTNLRLVWRYWDLMGQPERRIVISRTNAYHGSTLAGSSLGGMAPMHKQGGDAVAHIAHIEQPYFIKHANQGESEEDFGLRAAGWLEEKILELGPEQVAAFIAEPIQGAGGVIIPPASYWPEVQRIVDKYGILLIADEVICAFGRTGSWFAFQRLGIRPHLVTFAKGVTSGYVPLGGVLLSKQVAEPVIQLGGEFVHGYTYSGHPLACAVALENIAIIEGEGLIDRVAQDTGPYLADCYAILAQHPLVGSAETYGLLAALLLVKSKRPLRCFAAKQQVGVRARSHCFDNGLIMRAVEDRMIIAPPLIMTRQDIDEMTHRINKVLDLTYSELKGTSINSPFYI